MVGWKKNQRSGLNLANKTPLSAEGCRRRAPGLAQVACNSKQGDTCLGKDNRLLEHNRSGKARFQMHAIKYVMDNEGDTGKSEFDTRTHFIFKFTWNFFVFVKPRSIGHSRVSS